MIGGDEPLDATEVHPESYEAARALLGRAGVRMPVIWGGRGWGGGGVRPCTRLPILNAGHKVGCTCGAHLGWVGCQVGVGGSGWIDSAGRAELRRLATESTELRPEEVQLCEALGREVVDPRDR